MPYSSRKKILLVSMPYGALDRQALGISLLQSNLKSLGYQCDISYLTFPFAETIGIENYNWINALLPYTAFAGDWTFTESLYGRNEDKDQMYISEILKSTWQLDDFSIRKLQSIKKKACEFISYCIQAVNWDSYALVGFTSTFEQNIASLSLAKRLKTDHPEIQLFFGGANWEGNMGMELHKQFKFVDFACSGEGDKSFPSIVDYLLNPKSSIERIEEIKGIIYRSEGETKFTGPPDLIKEMNQLPIPDYSNYFDSLEQSQATYSITPQLLIETSRGCWWGAKSHCTFCGLNGGGMAFRSKSSSRVLEEIDTLYDKWGIPIFEVVDNILDMSYFDSFLPELADSDRNVRLFYEVKANLKRSHIEKLYRAGVHRIQPGIESMNNHVLKLMKKGTTFLQNILLLRLCKEYNIEVDWNILYGFPGETQEDYNDILALLPSIRFLNPPTACGPIRLDRFSPYFNSHKDYGLKNLRPYKSYQYLYPFDFESLMNVAYYFDFDYQDNVDPKGFADAVIRYVAEWTHNPEHGSVTARYDKVNKLKLVDSRSGTTAPVIHLSSAEQSIFEYCDGIRSLSSICKLLQTKYPNKHIKSVRIKSYLDSLVKSKLMISDGSKYLSLIIGLKPITNKMMKKEELVDL